VWYTNRRYLARHQQAPISQQKLRASFQRTLSKKSQGASAQEW